MNRATAGGIARPIGRARIETCPNMRIFELIMASPGQLAGRGLKLFEAAVKSASIWASPGQLAGRGLKQEVLMDNSDYGTSIARPIGRARIETPIRRDKHEDAGRHRPANWPGAD